MYQLPNRKSTTPYILAIRISFDKFKYISGKSLKFIITVYIGYPLAKQQFELEENQNFDLIQVIILTNNHVVSSNHSWIKHTAERLNRTFKFSYFIPMIMSLQIVLIF